MKISYTPCILCTFINWYIYSNTLRNCKKICIWHWRVKVKNRNFIYFWLRPTRRRLQSPNGFLIPTVANYVIKTRIIRHISSKPMTIESKSGLKKFLASKIITNLYIQGKKYGISWFHKSYVMHVWRAETLKKVERQKILPIRIMAEYVKNWGIWWESITKHSTTQRFKLVYIYL